MKANWFTDLESRINPKLKIFNLRQFLGGIVFIFGLLLVIASLYGFAQISHAQKTTSEVSKFFEHNPTWNPAIKFFGGEIQKKISSYYTPVSVALAVGVIFSAAGVFVMTRYRTKRKKR